MPKLERDNYSVRRSTDVVRPWIQQTYPELLGRAEILDTDLLKNAATGFKTIYDLRTYDGGTQTYNRAIDSFDAMVDEIEGHLQSAWTMQMAKEKVDVE